MSHTCMTLCVTRVLFYVVFVVVILVGDDGDSICTSYDRLMKTKPSRGSARANSHPNA